MSMVEERGLVFQGEARLVKGASFSKLKRIIEQLSGWHLDDWRINRSRPDSALVFMPKKIAEIGRI